MRCPPLTSLLTLLACGLTSSAAGPPVGPRLDLHGAPLPPHAVARFGDVRLACGSVERLAFSPNGKLLAGSAPTGIRVWDTETGKALHLAYLDGERGILIFAPDGSPVLSDARGLRVFDASTGRISAWLRRPGGPAAEVAFSPDGKRLAVAWEKGGLTLHDPTRPDMGTPVTVSTKKVSRICFSGDGSLLAGAADKAVLLWRVPSGELVRRYVAPETEDSAATALRLSPDGKVLAVSQGIPLRLWRTDANEEVAGFTLPRWWGEILRFSADGKTLTGVSRWGEVVRWSALSGKELARFGADKEPITERRLALSEAADLFAEQRHTEAVRVWSVPSGRAGPALEQLLPLQRVSFATKDTVAALRSDGSVVFWSASDGRLLREYKAPVEVPWLTHFALSPQGTYLAFPEGKGHEAGVYEAATGRKVHHLGPFRQSVSTLTFSPDGKALLVDAHSDLHLFDVATGALRRSIQVPGLVEFVTFAPDGRSVAAPGDEAIYLYELASGKLRREIPTPKRKDDFQGSYRVRFARNGHTLVLSRPGDLLAYGLTSGALLFHQKNVSAEVAALSPDGRWLAYNTRSTPTFSLRDLSDPRPGEPLTFHGHAGYVTDLTFSPDGTQLISAGADGTALVWDLTAIQARAPRLPSEPPGVAGAWKNLASADAVVADQAMRDLERYPALALPLLRSGLKAVPPGPSREQLAQLVTDLGSSDFDVRSAADKELEQLADLAEPALREAAGRKLPLEQARRVGRLLRSLEGPETDPERLRALRGVEVLERLGSPEAVAVLEALAKGAPAARLTQEARASLARLRGR